jgi:hypothetical protein
MQDKPNSTSIKLKSKASTFDIESRAAEPRNMHSHNVPPYHQLMDIKAFSFQATHHGGFTAAKVSQRLH